MKNDFYQSTILFDRSFDYGQDNELFLLSFQKLTVLQKNFQIVQEPQRCKIAVNKIDFRFKMLK